MRYQDPSTFQTRTPGMSQMTRMGTICFLVLSNDALLIDPHHLKYVDDSTMGAAIDNIVLDFTPLQDILNRLQRWAPDNHRQDSGNALLHHRCHPVGSYNCWQPFFAGCRVRQTV